MARTCAWAAVVYQGAWRGSGPLGDGRRQERVGWLVGASPARWLLPCLALTAAALALGEVVGLYRAASGLALGWAAATAAVAIVLALRRPTYTRLTSGR